MPIKLPLAKLFSATSAPAGAGTAPSPNFFVHNSPLPHPGAMPHSGVGKPTGSYPKHFWKHGGLGAWAVRRAQAGFQPATPNTGLGLHPTPPPGMKPNPK